MAPVLALAAPGGKQPSKPVTPNDVVAGAPAADWARIAPSDLMVMDLAPDAAGHARRVVIQLMPAPFSQGWVGNIRKLIAAHWFDGIAVVRVQDNYVVQWGDPDGETPGKAKPLPKGLMIGPEAQYEVPAVTPQPIRDPARGWVNALEDPYGLAQFWKGWPVGRDMLAKPSAQAHNWPLHCYGMVGVGRNNSPDTGTGAELYTVIGQAPRQLDRNIALVGRIIAGMENLSSLPRGTGEMGFYKTAAERTPIVSVRLGSDVPGLAGYEYLSTDSSSFTAYLHARANRRDAFYIHPAGGVDACNVPVPIRPVPAD
nr:peptidylprolyl isomerase [Novosphingobium sp. 9]